MSKVEFEDAEDKPLDPEMEKVRRKMIRLLVVSIGVMFLGVMAVLGGVVYKIIDDSGSQGAGAGEPLREVMATLPDGFVVESVSLDGSQVLFFGRDRDGRGQGLIYDTSNGRLTVRIDIRQ